MRWGPLAVGLGAYLIGLVATAPATLVDAGLQRASDGKLRLAEAQGTLWSGAGQIEIRAADGRIGIAKSIAWRFLPLTLLHGHLLCELELDNATKRFPVTISLSGVELAGADMGLPATALGLAVPKLAPLGLSGEVLLHIEQLSAGRRGVSGAATLQWRAAGSALTSVAPLGDYELRLKSDGMATYAALGTLQGPIQLDGKGSWESGVLPSFLATARIPRQHRQNLSPLLRLIAVERGEGDFELQLK